MSLLLRVFGRFEDRLKLFVLRELKQLFDLDNELLATIASHQFLERCLGLASLSQAAQSSMLVP